METKKTLKKKKRLTPFGVRVLAVTCLLVGTGAGFGISTAMNRSVQAAPVEEIVEEVMYTEEMVEEIKKHAFAEGKAEGLTEAQMIIKATTKAEMNASAEEDADETTASPTPEPTPDVTGEEAPVEEYQEEYTEEHEWTSTWNGQVLNASVGTIEGPSGIETYYNLPMQGVVNNAKRAGILGDYWVRSDGVKMLGDYILAACDVTGVAHNRYDIVETSLGEAICADTGGFAVNNPTQIDIAVSWGG